MFTTLCCQNCIRIGRCICTSFGMQFSQAKRSSGRMVRSTFLPGKTAFQMTLHMHVIWNAVFPGKKVERKDGSVYYRSKWLADNGAETGLGWVHDNRPLGSTASASSYVTKHITKNLDGTEW